MATPRGAKPATQRQDLSTFFEFDLMANLMGFIGYRVLPLFDVRYQADQFGRVERRDLGKIDKTERTSQGGYNRITWRFGKDNYSTQEHGLEGPVDQRNARIYQEIIDAYRSTTAIVTHKVLAAAEKRVADLLFNTSNFTPTSVTTEWSNKDATPITDVKAASQRVRDNIGQYANAVIINRLVKRNLQECTQIHERIAALGAGDRIKPVDITNDMLAKCFDVDQVIVADCTYDPSNEGQDTTSFVDIWDKEFAMVAKIATSRSLEEVCLGRTFHWTGDGSSANGRVETYYEDNVRSDIVRVRHEVDEKIIFAECGELLDNITA